jgi:hypothetical protein
MHSNDIVMVRSVIGGQEPVESAHAQKRKNMLPPGNSIALAENYVNASKRVKGLSFFI